MYELKSKTKEMAEYILGISYEDFVDIEFDESNAINRDLSFVPSDDERITGRGNPLLSRKEYLPMDVVDAYFAEVLNAD